MENRQGLAQAYKINTGTYVAGDSLFIAGTNSARDVWDDLKIPLGLTSRSQRYEDANRVLKANPQIRRIAGHSFGGAVALELQREHPEMKTITYGAPVISASGGERYRAVLDPFAMFDFGAKTELPRGLNPHSYSMAHQFHSFAENTSKNGYTTNGTEHLYR